MNNNVHESDLDTARSFRRRLRIALHRTITCSVRSGLLAVVLLAVMVVIGVYIGRSKLIPSEMTQNSPTKYISNVSNDQIEVTGIIRTSGLNDEEKQDLGLPAVHYQVTDLNTAELEIQGFYLLAERLAIDDYLGSCVRVAGTEPSEWKNQIRPNAYQRSVLIVDTIESLDSSNCNPYPTILEPDGSAKQMAFRGTVTLSTRPAPDIGYDYQLALSQPFLDEDNASGLPQQVTLYGAVPNSDAVWKDLSENLDREVELQGYLLWGYAESKYFRVTSVTRL